MLTGSCLCGAVRFEFEAIPGKVYNCHCSQCRKSHGAAFATQMFAHGHSLKFLQGEEHLREYRGHGGVRAFCAQCGSRLMNYAADKNIYLSIALSCVDSETEARPVAHAFVTSKAPWHEPSSDIPGYDAIPDGALERNAE